MSILRLVASCVAVTLVLGQKGSRKSKELNDKTFEHDTQATTGSTTGDWFVNFCSKSSKECREIQPLWDELAEKLFGRVSVAQVDLDRSKELSKRFGINTGPKLWLFRKRKFYQYDGAIDDIEALATFATDTYDQAKVQGDIPAEPGMGEKLWKELLSLIERSGDAVNKIVMKNDKEVNYTGMALVFGGPLLVMIAICTVILGGKEDPNVVGAIKREEAAASKKKTQ